MGLFQNTALHGDVLLGGGVEYGHLHHAFCILDMPRGVRAVVCPQQAYRDPIFFFVFSLPSLPGTHHGLVADRFRGKFTYARNDLNLVFLPTSLVNLSTMYMIPYNDVCHKILPPGSRSSRSAPRTRSATRATGTRTKVSNAKQVPT